MKEAIGGSWLYTLVIVMITLFTTFVSVTTNYARTYKIKDNLLSIIEKNGGVTAGDGGTLDQINGYLNSLGYTSTGDCDGIEGVKGWVGFSRTSNTGSVSYGSSANYCIYKHVISCRVDTNGKITFSGETGYNTIPRAYYGVAAFFRLDWPILRQVIKINLTGETSTLYLPNTNIEIAEFNDDGCSG